MSWSKSYSPKSHHQMILREESYGGTLFHPLDATFIQLDHEGFRVVHEVVQQGLGALRNDDEISFLDQVRSELPPAFRGDFANTRVVRLPTAANFLKVLSSPILVDFQITERCGLGCPQCYASSVTTGKDVSWEDAQLAVRTMAEAGVCQVALGGGEPLLHPRIADLLQLIREHGMVPNMTTTGLSMTDETLLSIRENCGAIAMSLEGVGERFKIRRKQGFAFFQRQLQRFLDAGVPTVLQVTVSRSNFDDLDDIVDYCLSVEDLYGVVFLAHKPAGRAEIFDQTLSALPHNRVHEKILSSIRRLQKQTRVGFDCCFSPALTGIESAMNFSHGTIVEGCSATRSGIGLTPDLDVLPCTFLGGKRLGNLRENSLFEIWTGSASQSFRGAMEKHSQTHESCRGCASNSSCLGGCSAWSLTGCSTKDRAKDLAKSREIESGVSS
jgi:radical SAM protein with 4Fe4S-binding SPASM domain